MGPKGVNGMANSADPDQTAPENAVLFAQNQVFEFLGLLW